MASTLRNANASWLLLGFVMYGLVELVAGWRWRMLLRVQGIDLGWFRIFSLLLIGVFFNFFIPGGTGGDVVKIYYLLKETPGKAHRRAALRAGRSHHRTLRAGRFRRGADCRQLAVADEFPPRGEICVARAHHPRGQLHRAARQLHHDQPGLDSSVAGADAGPRQTRRIGDGLQSLRTRLGIHAHRLRAFIGRARGLLRRLLLHRPGPAPQRQSDAHFRPALRHPARGQYALRHAHQPRRTRGPRRLVPGFLYHLCNVAKTDAVLISSTGYLLTFFGA